MKINNVTFITSAVEAAQYPKGQQPEIALAGRSNVGKSSLINQLLQRKSIARISQTPGKTQTLNFYHINHTFLFVDVPGYGYAKVPAHEKEKWGPMIETYLMNREQLKAVILIVDSRHRPTDDDVMMYDWLKYFEIPVIIVATKADKLKNSQIKKQLVLIQETLNIIDEDDLILFSAKTAQGKNDVLQMVEYYL